LYFVPPKTKRRERFPARAGWLNIGYGFPGFSGCSFFSPIS
jgi:hypothetical protein